MLTALLFSFLWASPALAGVDNPTPANFLRRPYANAVVLGDYVYIDGGELAQLEDGEYNGDHPSYPVNTTLSLPLNEAWTNDSVSLRSIEKAAPPQDQQVLWSDPANSAFYTWGGMSAWFGAAVENEIWKFTADGSGGGEWSEVSVSNVVAWSNSIRTVGSAYTTVNGIGYSVGGTATKYVDTSITGDSLAVQGLVTFDMGESQWKNASSAGLGANGTTFNGRLEYVPFGPSGFLILLGGSVAPVGALLEYEQLEWNNIWIMNLEDNTWHNQAVTGTKPTKREGHCTVGVQGPNGTYEIFIHGGSSDQTQTTSPDVYVLSLPGFVMFKSPNPGTPRSNLACVTVGRNDSATTNRQMLVVGGGNSWLGFPNSLVDPDPWAQGLGIFDLTDMSWSDSYDPDAAAYDSPDVVKTWYDQGGLDAVDWDSDELKTLFVGGTNSSSTNGNGTASDGTSSSGASTDSGNSDTGASSGSKTGVIVGSVVGGVAGLAIIALACWFFIRRRKHIYAPAKELDGNAGVQQTGAVYSQPPGYYQTGQEFEYKEMPANQAPQELDSQHTTSYAPDTQFAGPGAYQQPGLPHHSGQMHYTDPHAGQIYEAGSGYNQHQDYEVGYSGHH
ncbi:hypothetical protein PFICI_07827 [Pestalotiopsis fici W106-1]|uniref:Kelch repeat-containing protein n=1 Tax=Pestalotiopsis fici (strain W106-1 / CGMCC3.15140) TaxID=1229662 RepID=W3X2E1_PESFW|nr:uncharacterized protein PFICI_07827 [Pestalotiopsis fici W106-1]ETS80298.1 hypothetical protein PFICI_07827 [Pestalotiopsis fici W106-1]